MNKRLSYLLKNTGILMISNFASKILSFLLVPLYTYVLSKEDVGTYDAVVSTVTLIFPILTLNIADAMLRFLMDKNMKAHKVTAIGIRFMGFGILAATVGIIIIYITGVFSHNRSLYFLAYLYFLSYTINQFMLQYAKGIEKIFDLGLSGAIGTACVLGFNILFLLVLHTGVKGFFIANILGQLIPAIYLFIRTKVWHNFKVLKPIDKNLQKEMLLFSIPLIATTIGWWINSAFDKYIVIFFCGIEANGLLSVAYKIPGIITVVFSIFNQAWHLSAIKEYGEEDTSIFFGKLFNSLNLCVSFLCAILICITPVLARFLFAKDFYVAWQYVPFLLISSVFTAASSFYGPILSVKKNSKTMAASTIYGAIVNIVLNIILIYFIGIQGATIATVISNAVIYFVRKKAVRDDIIIDKYWRVFVIWGILIIQAVCKIYIGNWLVDAATIIGIVILNASIIKEILALLKGNVIRK